MKLNGRIALALVAEKERVVSKLKIQFEYATSVSRDFQNFSTRLIFTK